jgi:SAM-dependent methyltransferase
MEPEIYHKTAQSEESHWWFVGRRRILNDILKGLALPDNAPILEVGCGTGGNLPLLARYGRVYGMELDATAREYARRRQVGPILPGSLPDDIPFEGQLFNLLVLTDVLEHVDRDDLSLRHLSDRIQSGGYLLLTVPAFQGLWSRHDDLHHHKRRYNRDRLLELLVAAGFEVLLLSYLNTLLFPVIVTVRLCEKFPDCPCAQTHLTVKTWIMPPRGLGDMVNHNRQDSPAMEGLDCALPGSIFALLRRK